MTLVARPDGQLFVHPKRTDAGIDHFLEAHP